MDKEIVKAGDNIPNGIFINCNKGGQVL